MNNENEVELLKTISSINRDINSSKQIQKQRNIDTSQEQNAEVLNYDAVTGQFRVRDDSGNIFYAKSITNSSLQIGSQVSVVRPMGSTPVIDGLPK